MVLLAILNGYHSYLGAVVPVVPGVVTLIINTSQFLYSTHQSLSQSNILAIVFAFDAPKIWNVLPNDVCSATSVASFRKNLKTSMFAKTYLP